MRRGRDGADPRDVRAHLHAELAQEGLGEPAGRHPRGGLAGRGALEHVAHVRVPVLLDAGEVGVAGARQVHLLHLGLHRPRVHPLLPVLVVAVLDPHRHGAAQRAPVTDSGDDPLVLLDLHAPAAAVPKLAPGEVPSRCPRGAARGRPGGPRRWRRARSVGFARCYEAQRHGAHTLLMRVRAPGWRRDC